VSDNVYCYPGSNVLVNRFDIRDVEELNQIEMQRTQFNYALMQKNPVKGDFDVAHIKAIHYHLFYELYEWAGKFRTVNVAKVTDFCRHHLIEYNIVSIFNKLSKENYLIDVNQESICSRLAFYITEINATHPFREGNGRTQRMFISYLARVAGYDVDFSATTEDEMTAASIYSWSNDESKFAKIFERIITSISWDEQLKYAKRVLSSKNRVLQMLIEKDKNTAMI